MPTLINKTQEIQTGLEKESKTELVDYKLLENIDNLMKEISRDYLIKSHRSWVGAEKVIIYQNSN